MKKFSKILSVALLVALVLSLGVANAFADTYSVTVTPDDTDKATHSYEAYQIFAGDLDETGTKLSNITWGTGIDQDKLGTLATDINALRDSTAEGYVALTAESSAAAFADAIGALGATTDDATAQAVATAIGKALSSTTAGTGSSTGVSGLDAGYYLIKDVDDSLDGVTNGAYSRFMLQVVKTVTVQQKATVPSVEKKVKDINDTTEETTDWQDSADYDIGDSIEYKITGTLPSTFDDYATYTTYTFTDTLSGGLTPPDAKDVKVTLNTEDGTDLSGLFNVAVDGQVIKVSLKTGVDLKTATPAFSASSKIIVTYSAVLNEEAKIGSEGNSNTVGLEYSNNPNVGGDGTGKTPDDKVIVFTFRTVVNKIDENGDALVGAAFELFKKLPAASDTPNAFAEGEEPDVKYYVWKSLGEVKGTELTTFTWDGIDDGDYKLVETETPDGYNSIDPIEFTVTATHSVKDDNPVLLTLDGGVMGTGTVSTGTIQKDIENHSGAVLPSTGGIGTTIFYVVGGVLVLAAIILLVTKKRMSE